MLTRLAEFFIFGLAPLMLAALVVPADALAEEKVLTGEVLYRERIALPPNAKLKVELADVSLADAPAAIVAEQELANFGQVAAKFELRFDSAAIQPGHSFALQARITVDNQLWFLNDERHQLDPLTAGPQTILVKMVRQSQTSPEAGIADVDWSLRELDGVEVPDAGRPTFKVKPDGTVSGHSGCNRYFGKAEMTGSAISFGGIGSTFMACAPEIMEQERKLFDALSKVKAFRIENGALIFADAAGKDVLRFSAGA